MEPTYEASAGSSPVASPPSPSEGRMRLCRPPWLSQSKGAPEALGMRVQIPSASHSAFTNPVSCVDVEANAVNDGGRKASLLITDEKH